MKARLSEAKTGAIGDGEDARLNYAPRKRGGMSVGGKSYGAQKPDDVHAFHWKGIELAPGENRVEASAPDGMKDEAIWTYIAGGK